VELPRAVFAGFFPKITQPVPAWLENPRVRQICSVSTCISPGPAGWLEKWQHNQFGFYDSEALAYGVIDTPPERFDLYAYRLFPIRCLGDQIERLTLTSQSGPVPDTYEFLGYDIVTKSTADFFECSPLSCNSGAAEFDVNQFCLIATQDEAVRVLLAISRDGSYEPGPYYLFEVYRRRREAG
jgi:hypothetical protein